MVLQYIMNSLGFNQSIPIASLLYLRVDFHVFLCMSHNQSVCWGVASDSGIYVQ